MVSTRARFGPALCRTLLSFCKVIKSKQNFTIFKPHLLDVIGKNIILLLVSAYSQICTDMSPASSFVEIIRTRLTN